MVRGWLTDREPAASDSFHYCRDLCESQGEADQAWVWMLNLIAHFVAKDESWLDSIHTAKDWRQLGLSGIVDYWEVPPPLHNVHFGKYVYLPTEQAETYLKRCVLINYSTYICLCLFSWKENMIHEETVSSRL